MDAGGPCHLRQTLNGGFDLLAGDQHQIRHFIDDDDDIGQRVHVVGLLFVYRLAAFRIEAGLYGAGQDFALLGGIHDALIVTVDVADPEIRHRAIAVFHLANRPAQRNHGL